MRPSYAPLRWAFSVDPRNGWFDSFVMHRMGSDIAILMEDDDDKPTSFLWSSPHLTELNDPQMAADRAAALKAIFDGAMLLIYEDFIPFRLEGMIDLASGERVVTKAGNGLAEPFSASLPNLLAESDEVDRFSAWISLARVDDAVRHILVGIGLNSFSWISLYSLRDSLRHYGMGDSEIAKMAGVGSSELKRLLHTANSFKAIGPQARHGLMKQDPPDSPMVIEDAIAIMRRAATAFIDARYQQP